MQFELDALIWPMLHKYCKSAILIIDLTMNELPVIGILLFGQRTPGSLLGNIARRKKEFYYMTDTTSGQNESNSAL